MLHKDVSFVYTKFYKIIMQIHLQIKLIRLSIKYMEYNLFSREGKAK